MVFSSQIFLFVFLPFSLLGYYVIHKNLRNLYLFLVSMFFYAWAGKVLLLILLISISLNYLLGLLIPPAQKKNASLKNAIVILAVFLNLLLLGYFKYFNFLAGTLNDLIGVGIRIREITFVLGISFFTFSGISYILDVSSGKVEPQKNPLNFALYISFFPKLIQGPIARYKEVNNQINDRQLSIDKFAQGAYRFVVGLAKKVALADQLGVVVNQIYAAPALNNSTPIAWLGAIAYALQIYYDFSGYTDMALGLAKMLGFDLPENFNFPYISTSITEFWRRWHITLGSWFRDYVFYKLEYKRRKVKTLRQETNTLVVFFLTGLWHGAAWNFIIWGLLHGFVIAIETFFKHKKLQFHLPVIVKWILTILVLIVGWVLFRSPNLQYAGQTLGVMFGFLKPVNTGITLFWFLNAKIAAVLLVAALASVPWKQVFPRMYQHIEGTAARIILQDVGFVFLLVLSLILVMSSSYNSFIYFKF
jgi:alginate O-acetyltransferase complex protein AlgI